MIGIGSLWVKEGECSIGRWMMENNNYGKMKFWKGGGGGGGQR